LFRYEIDLQCCAGEVSGKPEVDYVADTRMGSRPTMVSAKGSNSLVLRQYFYKQVQQQNATTSRQYEALIKQGFRLVGHARRYQLARHVEPDLRLNLFRLSRGYFFCQHSSINQISFNEVGLLMFQVAKSKLDIGVL
jgi:hypothetical protein